MKTNLKFHAIAVAALSIACLASGHSSAQPTPANEALPAILPATPPRGIVPEGMERIEGEAEAEPKRDEIETDRDSFTPATTTVAKRRWILESAYTYTDSRRAKDGHSFPELLVRYGLTERLELRLGWNYEIAGIDRAPFDETERAGAMAYGMKYRITENECWKPGSAMILQAFTPTNGPANDTRFIGTYVFGWELPRRTKLDASMRYGTGSEHEDHFNEWAPSVVFKVPVGERVNVHAEYFGLFSTNKAEEFNQQYFSPGIHYLITPDFEIGVRVAWGLNDESARFFSNVGLGLRF